MECGSVTGGAIGDIVQLLICHKVLCSWNIRRLSLCRLLFNHPFCSTCSDEKEEEEYDKEEVGEDGEIILVSGDKVSGPWNKSGGAAPPPPAAPVGELFPHLENTKDTNYVLGKYALH